jgi:SAM-dependent methyltransferase
MDSQIKCFYDREYAFDQYCPKKRPESHSLYNSLKYFIDSFHLYGKSCLEIGCGRGIFQDMVEDYTGIDISDSVRPYIHKSFFQCSATQLPFSDNEYDAIWTIHVLEHIPDPEKVLIEIRRVIKPGGVLFLAPAWQCRPWAAKGYPVRPYSDFNLLGKINKTLIPIRNSLLFRSLNIFPKRIIRLFQLLIPSGPLVFKFKKLEPNFDNFWMEDSDAVNSMDPFEAIVWFTSYNDECINYPTIIRKFFVRTGPLIFRIKK